MKQDIKNVCGPYIRKTRLQKGWTQKELVEEMKKYNAILSESAIHRIENQTRRVYEKELHIFVRVLEVSYERMLGIAEFTRDDKFI